VRTLENLIAQLPSATKQQSLANAQTWTATEMEESRRRAVQLAGALLAMRLWWLVRLQDERSIPWKALTESVVFQQWLAFARVLNRRVLPQYHPKDAQGKIIPVPSKSPMPFAPEPRRLKDCKILQPIQLRGLTLRNRVIRAAAFDGDTEDDLIATHVDQSKGGVGMTTVAYCCVSHDGKTFDDQLVMEENRHDFLQSLTSQVHRYGAAISAQLTHGGSFADRECIGKIQLAPSAVFNTAGMDFPRAMTMEDCDEMAKNFANSARLAKECGFDCIELHVGHGYLLSQFLSPKMNVRNDKFGGDAKRRAEFPAECLRRCRTAVGEDFPIIVKMNVHDGMWGGLELADAMVAAEILTDASADAIIVTCGNVSRSGMYMLRGKTPQERLVQTLPHALKKVAMMIFGPFAAPDFYYEDCFLRDSARYVLEKPGAKVPVILMGGVNSLSEMEGAMEEGFACVQIARGLIREPDLVNRIEANIRFVEEEEEIENVEALLNVSSSCIRCNMCVIASFDPDSSSGCPFQKLDVKRRNAKGFNGVMSVQEHRQVLRNAKWNGTRRNKSISMQGISASKERDLRDLEDLIVASKPQKL